MVVLLKNTEGETKIGFIDYGEKTKIHLLGNDDDPFYIRNYGWIGVFEKINPGEALWSNYGEDFIDFENVPEDKKVRLTYNALYIHASESCGGGFIYWKDGKFNWLPQE